MSDRTILFLFIGIFILLTGIIIYQQFIFTRGIQTELETIRKSLANILENDSNEKVMVFTDNQTLMLLCAQINQLLSDRQKIKANFQRQELSSKKMLANISHDIKTPLTVVLGYLEILRLNNPQDESLQKAEAKATQVMELINQFFTLAKLEAGDNNIEINKIKLNELCRENILSFYDLLIHNEFEVEVSIPEEPLFVQGDKKSIDRILSNLLSNVIRYGNDGKYLGVFLWEQDNFACIDITDKGKGIEKEFAARVFERLYTIEDSRNRQIQGNGLGLTIAKNLAIQLGGDIILESQPNIQTTFTIKLKKWNSSKY